jgi:hypothetical protein
MEHANSDTVPEGGEYICTSCGNVQEFEEADDFSICDACGDDTAGWEQKVPEVVEEGLGEEEGL